ncbi:MAG: hypothetical protein HY824_08610, partial [Acidobacteria bacterium]|nr:hypothetical protein [Acidobacteriota bacterium]
RRRVPLAPRRGGWAVALAALALAVAVLLGGLPIGTWLSELDVAPPAGAPQSASEEPLPIVRPSEMVLARARTLYAGGHLRDALKALDRIGIADSFRAEADRLRADIQRDVLAAAGSSSGAPAGESGRP